MAIHLGDGVFNLKGNMTHLVATMGMARKKIGLAMAAAGAAVVVGLGKAIKGAADFESAITNAASVTGKTGAAFDEARDKMTKLAKVMTRETKFTLIETANAMYDLSSKGFDVANMTRDELIPIFDLAAATQSDLAQSTEIVTGTLRAFGMENQETARIADVLAYSIGNSAAKLEYFRTSLPLVSTTFSNLNLSFEETVALLSEMYNRNIDASRSATGLRNVMADLHAQKKPIVDGFKAINVSLKGIDFEGSNAIDVFKELVKRGMTASDAMIIFGKRSGDMAAVIAKTVETIEGFKNELDAAGGTARTVAQLQLEALKEKVNILKGSLSVIAMEIGTVFLPILKILVDALTRVANAFSRWIELHPALFEFLTWLAGMLGVTLVVAGLKFAFAMGVATKALVGLAAAKGAAGFAAGGAGAAAAGGGLKGAAVATGAALGGLGIAGGIAAVGLVALGGVIVYTVVKAFQSFHEAVVELIESEERLAAQEKLLAEQETRLLADRLKQRTGFSTRVIELIEKQLEIEHGVTMERERLVQRIVEINKDHTMSVTELINALKEESESAAQVIVKSTDKIDTSYKESMSYKKWAYGKTAEYIAQQVSQQTGLYLTTQQVLEGMALLEEDKSRSTQDMIQILSTAVTSGARTWKGAFSKMAKATEEETAKISGDLGRVSEQIAALQRQMMQMGGASWWMDIWNNMTAATNRWQKYFGQSITGALDNLRTLKSGSETIMGSFGFPSPAVETIMGGNIRGFGTTVVPSSISDAMLAQLAAGGGGGANVTVTGNTFVADDWNPDKARSVAEHLFEMMQEEGWGMGVSLA